MTDPTHNPYSPPREQPPDETVDAVPRRNYLLEAIKAFVTVVSLFAGWIVVAAGLVNQRVSLVFLGILIMVVTCGLAIAKKIKLLVK